MKKKVKQRLFAFVLCIVMIITSINLTNIFNNNLNAAAIKQFNYTGNVQQYTIPTSGYYLVELYGGAGGGYSLYGGGNTIAGGNGGYISAKMYFNQGEILYVYVGNAGAYGGTVAKHTAGGWNGGGDSNNFCGSGGGATDIRIGGTSLSNRILIAGGGAGSARNKQGLDGGAATSGNNGVLGNGSSSSYSGGGGGYYGGTAGASDSTQAKGGSNYINTSKGTLIASKSGVNNTIGSASIQLIQDCSVQIKLNGGNINGSTSDIIYSKTTADISGAAKAFNYTGQVQTYKVPKDAYYTINLYGAQGGMDAGHYGKGGYVSAKAYLTKDTVVYIYVGGAGGNAGSGVGGWNGGGRGGYNEGGGGGATDIRIGGTDISNRTLVAGGGGGGGNWDSLNGHGGLNTNLYTLYYGESTNNYTSDGAGAGGGGGYYGGRRFLTNQEWGDYGAYGGSNYISSSYTALANSSGARTGNGYATIECQYDEILTTPTRTGYTFIGWKVTSGKGTVNNNYFKYGAGETIVEAQWTKNSTASTLIVNPNGGVFNDSKNQSTYTQDKNTTLHIPTPTRDGYVFNGWTKSSTFYGTISSTTSATTYTFGSTAGVTSTLTANWARVTSSLTINPNSGIYNNSSNIIVENNITSGTSKNILTPTKHGYTFSHWRLEGAESYFKDNNTLIMGIANTYLTAEWKINQYTVTVKPNGGTWNNSTSNSNFTMDYNSTKTIEKPIAPTGYVFSGWTFIGTDATMSSLTEKSTLKMGVSNITLTANYVKDEFEVTYIDVIDSENGTELNRWTETKYYGDTISGSDKGNITQDNTYYFGYYLYKTTSKTVNLENNVVYRIFKLRTIDVTGSVNWIDNSNKHNTRPQEVYIYLLKNGVAINQVKGLTSSNDNAFSFKDLPKYNTNNGEAYVYTVLQSEVESLTNPEDTYSTSQTGYNFINTLGNYNIKESPNPVDPPEIKDSYEIKGTIKWIDENDKLGRRPYDIELVLYQNGKEYSKGIYTVDSKTNDFEYAFTNLPKYDSNINRYAYTVEQKFTSKVLTWNETLKDYEEINAYTSTTSDNLNFVNTLVDTKNKPVIEVKPEHINTLNLKLAFNNTIDWKEVEISQSNVKLNISFKQMEMISNSGATSYTNKYSGMTYNTILTNKGITISNIPSGKYEITTQNSLFELENIKLSNASNMTIVKENGKDYLIIDSTNTNNNGTITFTLNVKDHNGYQTSEGKNNIYQ